MRALVRMSCALLAVVVATGECFAQAFWQFRGSNFGHVQDRTLPIEWGGFLQEPVWKTAIPGKGWSSPIVVGDKIWVTGAEQEALDEIAETDKLAKLPFNRADYVGHRSVKLFAAVLDGPSGKLEQRIDLFEQADPEPIHTMNSYASPTAVSDGKLVICHFGALGTACIDASSKHVLWKKQIEVKEITGGGTSPALDDDLVYLACDGADQQFIVALDKHSGSERWKKSRPAIDVNDDTKRRAFSTPIVIEWNHRKQLVSMSAQWLLSYNPKTGEEYWRAHVGTGYSAVPTPVFAEGRVYVCTGYYTPELVCVDVAGEGDVTDTHIAWRVTGQVPEISSPIVYQDAVYFGSSKGVISCVDRITGKQHWQQRVGGNIAASPIATDRGIYFTNTQGLTFVIEPGTSEYKLLAKNELFGETYASLVPIESDLLIRTNSFFVPPFISHALTRGCGPIESAAASFISGTR